MFNRQKTLAVIASLLLSLFSFAFAGEGTTQYFHERFEKVRGEDGSLITIRDSSITTRFRIAPYLKFIKEKLLEEQALMHSKNNYEAEVESLLTEDFIQKGDRDSRNIRYTMEALRELKKLDIEKIFSNPKFQEVMTRFESKIGKALEMLDPRVMAKPDNSSFFYRKAVTHQVLKWGLSLAKKMLGQVPLLNTASYVLEKVEKLVRERRVFHQNILLHYLENFSAEELGMTRKEINLTLSSIYESRIQWFAFWESKAAKQNWDRYGFNKFYMFVRAANKRLIDERARYSRNGKRLNYVFREVTEGDDDVIINLVDNNDLFNRKPAIAYYVNDEGKIARKRLILQLAGLGLSFVSIPEFIKNGVDTYLKSHYEKQKLTEGGLYGYFEATGNKEGRAEVIGQYLNPFDILE